MIFESNIPWPKNHFQFKTTFQHQNTPHPFPVKPKVFSRLFWGLIPQFLIRFLSEFLTVVGIHAPEAKTIHDFT